MNNLILPPCPNWANNNVLACSNDGIVIYGARNNHIIIITPSIDINQSADIQCIYDAHNNGRIVGIAIDHINWNKDDKYIVSAGDDNLVKLWDFHSLQLKKVQNYYNKDNFGKCVAITYVDNKVVSISDTGRIIVWDVIQNKLRILKSFAKNQQFTCMATSAHTPSISCFGTRSGYVYIINTKLKGQLLHKFKCNDGDIFNLSFCPVPNNIFKNIKRIISTTTEHKNELDTIMSKCQIDKRNVWTNLQFPDDDDDDDINIVKRDDVVKVDDFLDECTKLQTDLKNLAEESSTNNSICSTELSSPVQYVNNKSCTKNTTPISGIITNPDAENIDNNLNNRLLGLLNEVQEHDTTYEYLNTSTESSNEQESISELCDNKEILAKELENVLESNFADSDGDEFIKHAAQFEKYLLMKKFNTNCSIASSLNVEIDESIDNISDRDEKNELLLAVNGRNCSPSIWCISDEFYLLYKLKIGRNKKKNRNQREPVTTLYWATPHLILFSTVDSELKAWDLNENETKNTSNWCRLIHSHHQKKGIFGIITPPYNTNNVINCVWTFGNDRYIICTSLDAKHTCLNYYPTCNGFIYSLCASNVDPGRVAIGVGDRTIREINFNKSPKQIVFVNTLRQTFEKVMAVAQHPTEENRLAFGCSDGRIGITDPTNPSKPALYLYQHFYKTIYSVIWGPSLKSTNNYSLYTYANGIAVIYDALDKTTKPIKIEFDNCDKYLLTALNWKKDFSILTVGSSTGNVIFLKANFDYLCMTFDLKSKIQCLEWFGNNSLDANVVLYTNYLAVGSTDVNIIVYDCQKLLLGERPKVISTLVGHTKPVNSLAWEPNLSLKLLSASCDGTVRVWDVKTSTVLNIFLAGHDKNSIFTAIWSPLNSDYVIFGGRDSFLRVVKISDYPPTKMKIIKNACVQNASLEDGDNMKTTGDCNKTVSVARNSSQINKSNNTFFPLLTNNLYTQPVYVTQQLFHNIVNKTNCNKDSDDDTIEVYKLFGTEDDAVSLIQSEYNKQLEKSNYDQVEYIDIWNGNIKSAIEKAIKNGKLTAELVSLAPMVSQRFWRQTCLEYANSLVASNQIRSAVVYYLIINEVEQAVDVLLDVKCFHDALLLVKTRMPSNTILINSILEKWASESHQSGLTFTEAQCYMALKQYYSAANILARHKSDKSLLDIALKLAQSANNNNIDLIQSIETNIEKLNEIDVDLKQLPLLTDLVNTNQIQVCIAHEENVQE